MTRFLHSFGDTVDLSPLPPADRDLCLYWLRHEAPRWTDTVNLAIASSPHRVLDVGCKYAVYDLFMARLLGIEVQGLDTPAIFPRLDAYWKANGMDVRPCDLTRDTPPFSPETFDVVIAAEVIEHVRTSADAVFAKLTPLLRPGGWLVVTTPNVCRLSNVIRLLQGRNLVPPLGDTRGRPDMHPTDEWNHLREYTRDEVIEALRSAGLTDPRLQMSTCWDRPDSSGERTAFRRALKTAWHPVCRLFPRHLACIMAMARKPAASGPSA